MREQDRQRAGALVDLAALDPDPPVFDHVDPAVAVLTDRTRHGSDKLGQRHRGPVERDRPALFEAQHELARVARGVLDAARECIDVFRRCDPGVFEDPAFDGASPEVLVDGVGAALGHPDGDVVLARVLDRVFAGEPPDADGRQHVEVRRKRAHRDLEPHLIVAFAGTTVRDRAGAVLAGGADEMTRDDRPRERRDQRVLALVERVRAQGGNDEVGRELLTGVDDDGLDRAGRPRPLADDVPRVVDALADVDGERDDLGVPFLGDPPDRDRGIEATGVCEHDPLQRSVC